jgi:lysophospholipase L1-like esterase
MTQATTIFQNSGVDVVFLMIGTNDIAGNVSSGVYKSNVETIINTLKTDGGVKKIILDRPIYSSSRDMNLLATYTPVLYELVDGETVLLGDIDAYDWFALDPDTTLNPVEVWSGVHPTISGYVALGNFWASAYKRLIIDPITMSHHFTNANGSTYVKGSNI